MTIMVRRSLIPPSPDDSVEESPREHGAALFDGRVRLEDCPDAVDPEVARRVIGVGRNKIYDMLREGALLSRRVGRKYIIPRAALEQFIAVVPIPAT